MKGLKREALEAGLARKYRYLNALRDLKRGVEDAIAERFVDLRPGDWGAGESEGWTDREADDDGDGADRGLGASEGEGWADGACW